MSNINRLKGLTGVVKGIDKGEGLKRCKCLVKIETGYKTGYIINIGMLNRWKQRDSRRNVASSITATC